MKRMLALCLLALTLSACIAFPPTPYRPFTPYQKSLLAKIDCTGVTVVHRGDLLRLVIPVDRYFELDTTKLHPDRVRTLVTITKLVRSYASNFAHPAIRVYGYMGEVFGRAHRRYLSDEYAQVIASYLWRKGVKAYVMQVKGFGAQHPIASQRTVAGQGLNRRVVIDVFFHNARA